MYTIKEVAKRLDVSEHTLRFWDKSGFFPFVNRDKNNVRNFSDSDLNWVYIVKCLRSAGADNKAIKRYIDLCIIGDSTIEERYEIIKSTRVKAEEQMKELLIQMEVLEKKEQYYENMIANKENDKCNPMNLRNNFDAFLKTSMANK
ncbi:MAG: hypothetical protein A2039_00695 [Candidatus Melainabacteria bacterium GWA2_34_9]|nr:MAG: hypothetical protein A2039_00695 [Candidatus Melainabacteria bacterium GWA2_34_9]